MADRESLFAFLRRVKAKEVLWADELPFHDEVLIAAHDKPSYSGDPGTGFEVWSAGDRVFLSMFWDGADRQVWELTAE